MNEPNSKRTATGQMVKLAVLVVTAMASQHALGQGGTTHESTPECCGTKPTFAQVPQPNAYASYNGQIAAVTCFPSNPSGGFPAPFDPTAFAFGIVDLQNPAPPVNVNYAAPMFHGPAGNQWTGAKLGSIFGVCFDDRGNIYLTPTTCYYQDVPGLSGNLGSVYKVDGVTGLITVFATLPNTVVGGISAGLGNIKYSCQHSNFYVSDLDDGKIYQLSTSGAILSTWDHGVNLPTATPPGPAIPDAAGTAFTRLGRRVWGLKPHNGRLYYAIWWEDQARPDATHTNEIWSIALTATGAFVAGSQTLEVLMPPVGVNGGNAYSEPVADISFGPAGEMLLAERSMSGDSTPGTHNSRLLEYVLSGTWTLPNPTKYKISAIYPPGSDAGGCDYDFTPGGRVWTTGDALHLNPNDYIYGLQGLPLSGGNLLNSVLIDLDGYVLSTAVKTEIGDVELPCVAGGGCLFITNEVVDCIGTNGTFTYKFCVTNQFSGPVSYLSLLDPPTGVTFNPDVIPLPVTLQPGQGTCVTVTITNTSASTNLCFRIGAHTTNFVQCCAVPHCISLPKCCVYLNKETVVPDSTSPNCYTYTFTINNVTVPPVPIQYVILVPDPPNTCFTFTPDIIYLNPALLPGQSITKTVKICLTPPCKQPFCFYVSVHDTNFNKCCSIYHCLSPVNGALKLVTPPDNSDFTSPVNIGLSATANPAVGITQVVFYANDAAVANGTPDAQGTGAYNGVWSNAPPGFYSLTAHGNSSAGTWISDPASILVYSNAPGGSTPIITSVRVSNGTVSLTVPTEQGVSCAVEWSPSLQPPNWQTLRNIIGDGSVMTINDSATNAPHRYYRLRMP